MSPNRLSKVFSSDSKSLWNVSLAPGWTKAECEVLRCAIMKYGIGSWNAMIKTNILPGKSVAQIVCQVQRMLGQQSLKGRQMGGNTNQFLHIHLDVYAVGRDNAKRMDVCRKNRIIINDGHNFTSEEIQQKRDAAKKKYGLTKAEIAQVQIPKLTDNQTSGVFDKKTSEQLERDKLLSRLAVLRNALTVLQNKQKKPSSGIKRKRTSTKRTYFSDDSTDSSDLDIVTDLSSLPKRQSRRQRGLAPEISLNEDDSY